MQDVFTLLLSVLNICGSQKNDAAAGATHGMYPDIAGFSSCIVGSVMIGCCSGESSSTDRLLLSSEVSVEM